MSKEQKAIGYRLILFIVALAAMILLAGFAFSTGEEATAASKDARISVSDIK